MTRTTRAGSLPAGLALPTLAALSLFLGGCPITKRPRHDAGLDAGRDADAPGLDAGPGPDAGEPERDAGSDAGTNTGDAGSPDIVLAVDFEGTPLGAYTDARVRADWPGTRFVMSTRATIVEEGGNRFVRVLYPEGTWGSSTNGAQWQVGFVRSYRELWLRYRVRFGQGFNPVRGGKLPGLIGGAANVGGRPSNGTDGWSARMMWRSELAAVQYVYHADQPTQYGQDFPWNIGGQRHFVPGTWHTVEHRIVMNTPGVNDGIIQGWLDGELALDARTIRFRDVDTFAIDGIYFSTFFGGSTADWAPVKDEIVDFDDFVVSTARLP